jgi:hypothetical protein
MYPLLLSAVIIYTAVIANASRGEVVWWETGVLIYPPGVIGVTAMAAVLLTDWSDRAKTIGAAVLSFVAGGFSETMISTEFGLLSACIGLSFIFPSGFLARVRRPLCAALLAAALIFAITLAAPSNAVRVGYEGSHRISILLAGYRSLRFSLGHFARYIYLNGVGTLLTFTVGALIGTEHPALVRPLQFSRKRGLQVVALFAAAWFVMSAYYAPMVLVYGAGGSVGRQTIIADFFMAIYATAFGYEVGRNLPNMATRWSAISMVTLAIALLTLSIRPALDGVNIIRYDTARAAVMAREFDEQERQLAALAANGATEAHVGYYVFWDEVDSSEAHNPRSNHNQSAAVYYGFRRFVGQ